MANYRVNVGSKVLDVTLLERSAGRVRFAIDAKEYVVDIEPSFKEKTPTNKIDSTTGSSSGIVSSPITGIVSSIAVSAGSIVKAGQTLLTIEAMKMENPIVAQADGVVKSVAAVVGQEVRAGQVVVEIGS